MRKMPSLISSSFVGMAVLSSFSRGRCAPAALISRRGGQLRAQIGDQRSEPLRAARSEDVVVGPLDDNVAAIFVHQLAIKAFAIDHRIRRWRSGCIDQRNDRAAEALPERAIFGAKRAPVIDAAGENEKAAAGYIVKATLDRAAAHAPLRESIARARNATASDETLFDARNAEGDELFLAARTVLLRLHGHQLRVAQLHLLRVALVHVQSDPH